MRSAWAEVQLGDIVTILSGGTPKKDDASFWGGDIPWISGATMRGIRIHASDRRLTQRGLENGSRIAPTGASLILVRGMSLLEEIRIGQAMQDVAFNQDVKALVPTPTVEPWFLTYALLARQPQLLRAVHQAGHGTGVLATDILRQLPIALPPMDEQRRIAGVLGALDDLIDGDLDLIDALTSLVQAEFERRFGLRELTQTVADVATVVDCLHSKKPARASTGGLLLQLSNILDSGLLDLHETYLIEEDDYRRWTTNLETQQWDCVITNVGRVGAVARIPVDVSAALGRNMTAIRPQIPGRDGSFILAALLSPAVRQEIDSRKDAGTILDALNVRSIPKLRIQSASESERSRFQDFAEPLLTLADSLHRERWSLSRQRDELLPLLLSGRVQVGEIAA